MNNNIIEALKNQPCLEDISERAITQYSKDNPSDENETLSITQGGKKLLRDIEGKSKKKTDEEFYKFLNEQFGDGTNEDWMERYFKIPTNDRMKNYQVFEAFSKCEFERNESLKNLKKEWFDGVYAESKNQAKMFEVNDSLIPILVNTKSDSGEMPFEHMMIDCNVEILDRKYLAFHVGSYETMEIPHKKYRGVWAFYTHYQEGWKERKWWFDYFDIDDFNENKLTKYQKQAKNFLLSFFNFLNEPEVEIVTREYSECNTKKRIERGLIPIPKNNIVRVTGRLKEYINELNQYTSVRSYGYRFWVRGHFVHLRNKKKYNKLYNLSDDKLKDRGYQTFNDIIRKWKKPYVKGKGILINKSYEVKK